MAKDPRAPRARWREEHGELWGEQAVGAEDRAGARGVGDGNEIGMGAGGLRSREREHLRPQRAQDARHADLGRRRQVAGRVHLVEVRALSSEPSSIACASRA
jgi:hypothetical protein